MEIIIGVICLLAGLLIGYLFASKAKNTASDEQLGNARVTIGELQTRIAERDRAASERAAETERLHAEALEQQAAHHREALEQQDLRHREALDALKKQFEETVNTMSEKMGNVTEEMLRQRQNEFAVASKERLDQLLAPLQAGIKEMKETVDANTSKHSELGGKLDAGLATLLSQTAAARASADKLADALKGSNRIQGEWGETVLRELLESQGLQEGIHFHTQSVIKDAEGNSIVNDAGNTMRPDIVLHLDRSRDVVIDSKVSLSAYLEYVNAKDEESRKAALDAHIRSIESHINELVKKDYSSYIAEGKSSLGYVIMFVPITSALLLATTHKSDLWRKAMERKVYIADEQTLYAALKIISMTWQQIVQAANHEKVYALAQEMLDRVGAFMQRYMEIGARLEGATKSFNDGLAKLREGGQSIPGTCRKLVKLGAKPKRKDYKGVSPEMIGLDETAELPD